MTTAIQWTWVPLPDGTLAKGETWNPVVGCGHVSAGWPWPLPNVWLGTSTENQEMANLRIPPLLETPAAIHFISDEPCLQDINLSRWLCGAMPEGAKLRGVGLSGSTYVPGLDWVIIGGESGKHARPLELAWVESLLSQCWEAQVPAFVKQLGAVWAHANRAHGVRDSHGGVMADWPAHLRIREFPQPQTDGDA